MSQPPKSTSGDGMAQPMKLSVIISNFNGAASLPEAIKSVLNENLPSVEVIVVDDASTDGSEMLLKAFGAPVRTIRLPKNSGGCAKPRNVGLDAARGQYIAVLDSDDVFVPGSLQQRM